VDGALSEPVDAVAALPVACGLACGGSDRMDALVPVGAVVVLVGLSLRVIDDLADDDDECALDRAIGIGRAANAASALQAIAMRAVGAVPAPTVRLEAMRAAITDAVVEIARGQDVDMAEGAESLAAYREVVARKTVSAYVLAAELGALAVTIEEERLARARTCGAHVGWMAQILDDLEGLWFPADGDDLARERMTFPALHGLREGRAAVLEAHAQGPSARPRLRALLDGMGVRRELMTAVLDHRDAALSSLGPPLDPAGLTVLQPWLDWTLRDAGELLDGV